MEANYIGLLKNSNLPPHFIERNILISKMQIIFKLTLQFSTRILVKFEELPIFYANKSSESGGGGDIAPKG